jgi:hypothetical protein
MMATPLQFSSEPSAIILPHDLWQLILSYESPIMILDIREVCFKPKQARLLKRYMNLYCVCKSIQNSLNGCLIPFHCGSYLNTNSSSWLIDDIYSLYKAYGLYLIGAGWTDKLLIMRYNGINDIFNKYPMEIFSQLWENGKLVNIYHYSGSSCIATLQSEDVQVEITNDTHIGHFSIKRAMKSAFHTLRIINDEKLINRIFDSM